MALSDYDQSSLNRVSMAQSQRVGLLKSDITGHESFQFQSDQGGIYDKAVERDPYRSYDNSVSSWDSREGSRTINYTSANHSDMGNRGGILETARDQNGSPLSRGQLKDSDTLEVGGMRSSVAALVAAGLLYQDQDGRYSWANEPTPNNRGLDRPQPEVEQRYQPQQEQRQQPQQQPEIAPQDHPPVELELPSGLSPEDYQKAIEFKKMAEDGYAVSSPKDELALSKLISDVPQPIYNAALNKAIEGGLGAVDWYDVASASGISVEEAKERGAVAHSIMVNNADRLTKQQGISNPREFYAWLAEKHPETFSRSQRELFGSRTSNTLKAATREYLRNISPSEADYRQSGYATKKAASGELMVQVDGAWYSSTSLVKGGYIKTY